jgi:protease-4
MAKFFKSLLLTVVGAIVTAIFLVLILVGIISSMASAGEKEIKIKEGTLLTINLDKPIVDRGVEDPFADLLGESPFPSSSIGLNDILKNIKKASRDKNIVGIYLECGNPMTGYATLNEIREALVAFKDSGKFICSFANNYSQKGYYLASAATKIYMPPQGMLQLVGLSTERMYYKKAMEKFNVDFYIFKHGKYKSAVEPYLLDEMSEPAREQTSVFLHSIWNHVKNDIASSRGLNADQINTIANNGGMFTSNETYLENHIIDGLKYKDEIIAELKELTSTDKDKDIEQVNFVDYKSVYVANETKGLIKDKIAVIYAEGGIDDGSSKGIDSETLSKTIREAREDSSIKAIVFRVNSPGGSASGSDVIWREIKLCKEAKPTIVSMGDYAASGGYYISCAADTIVANPVTLTGSIGIFARIPNFERLADKYGIHFDGVKTNKYSDFPTVTRQYTEDEKELVQQYVERGYLVFTGVCAEGRNTSPEAIDEIGQGRVWTGENAIEHNLVDVMGGLNKAIDIASEKAGLELYRIKELPEKLSPIEELLKNMKNEAKAYMTESLLGINYKQVEMINNLKKMDPIQARLPYDITLN